ncbi:MAG: hypothetical protein ACJAVM_001871 [Sulfitobacter sp.]|jgi:hypothetical protein
MTSVKMTATLCALLLALSACSTSSTPTPNLDRADPRYASLLAADLPAFYGTLAVAVLVSNDCSGLQRNPRIDLELNERRNEQGKGSFAALTQRQAIKNAQIASSESFKRKHGNNLCAAAARDFDQATKNYTYFLVRPS